MKNQQNRKIWSLWYKILIFCKELYIVARYGYGLIDLNFNFS